VNERLLKLAQRISDELGELERIIKRAQEGWRRTQQLSDDLYLDGVALNLHSFYGGLERLFELIATAVDGNLPQGANWHRVLLEQMAMEMPDVRPAVISEMTCEALDEYRGFRHIVRHVYTFEFDAAKMQRLVEGAPTVFARVRSELLAFANFLKQQAELPQSSEP
jgi:hypothetical protein